MNSNDILQFVSKIDSKLSEPILVNNNEIDYNIKEKKFIFKSSLNEESK
jgi:hypothetical protein